MLKWNRSSPPKQNLNNHMKTVIWNSRKVYFFCFFSFKKKENDFDQTKYAKFFTISKETFPLFLCSYRDTQFFETGPRKSTITEISTINNPIDLSILSHGNFKIKVILGMKVYSHCNKGGGCIFHQSQFLNKTFRNIVIFEISDIFLSILQKLSNFKNPRFH